MRRPAPTTRWEPYVGRGEPEVSRDAMDQVSWTGTGARFGKGFATQGIGLFGGLSFSVRACPCSLTAGS